MVCIMYTCFFSVVTVSLSALLCNIIIIVGDTNHYTNAIIIQIDSETIILGEKIGKLETEGGGLKYQQGMELL